MKRISLLFLFLICIFLPSKARLYDRIKDVVPLADARKHQYYTVNTYKNFIFRY